MRWTRGLALLEVGIFYGMVHFVIWGGRERRPAAVLIVLILLAISLGSNFIHKDTLERVGLASKHFFQNLKWTFLLCAPFVVVLWFFAWKNRYEGLWDWSFGLLGYPLWAFVQEYVLLGFVANRLEDGLGRPSLVPWINGLLFGMAHLPNPVLMCVTFSSGVLFTALFLKHRHLAPLTLVHAAVGLGISLALGHINGIMSVGPGYYARIGTLPY